MGMGAIELVPGGGVKPTGGAGLESREMFAEQNVKYRHPRNPFWMKQGNVTGGPELTPAETQFLAQRRASPELQARCRPANDPAETCDGATRHQVALNARRLSMRCCMG